MKLIYACVRYPVTTTVGVILAVLFGVISLYRIPVQMTPTVDRPVITVETTYKGAAPLEMEEEVTNRLEEKLTSVEGLTQMTSSSEEDRSRVIMEFDWGTNKDIARLDVSEKLGLVKDFPLDADRPVIQAVNSDAEQPIAWIIVDTDLPINEVRIEGDNVIRPKLERVPGVGAVWMFGGEDREVRVTLDYAAMSARGLTVWALRDSLLRENQNTKGGAIDEGKRRYSVRTVGSFTSLDHLRDTIVAQTPAGPVYLRDIAKVSFDYEDPVNRIRINRKRTMGFGVLRKTGSNTIEVMAGLKQAIREVNDVYRGRGLQLRQVYDETDYIYQSRGLVVNNIFIGGALAVMVLLLFLGSVSSVFVIAVAIPVSVVATFIFVYVLGRSINIISLAGLAFAVGMVLDNSIVVLENIYRHREMGKDRWQAAMDGGTEVWGAVLASSLTTLAVFIPVLFVQDEAGQLFRDIAIAISVAVGLSLVVSLTVVPMLSARVLRSIGGGTTWLTRLQERVGLFALGRFAQALLVKQLGWLMAGVVRRVAFVGVLTVASLLAAWQFFPPIDYLPKGNRNLIFAFFRTPAGLNLEEIDRIVSGVEEKISRVPEIERFFAVGRLQNPIMGILAREEYTDQESMRQIVGKLMGMVQGIPGVQAFVTQAELFRRRGGGFIGGVNLQVDVRGDSLDEIQRIAADIESRARRMQGVNFVNSSFDLGNPELQVHVDREKAAALGVSVREVGNVVETLVNGTQAGLFRDKGKELDIVLRAPLSDFRQTQDLSKIKVHTADGRMVQLNDLAEIRQALGPTKIEHIDRDRSLTLTVNISEDIPLQVAIDRVKQEVLEPVRIGLPLGYSVDVTGRAKDLARAWDALKWSFLLALLITYLLMAALFEAWSYPLIIMFSVPFAATGGVLAVGAMNWLEPSVKMDTVTMLGFIILTGTVVNNAILLVHQALNHAASGLPVRAAILESARDRMRPIFMTTTTTMLGMFPLVASSGAGSELYRGLGSAILGGLAVATMFTLVMIPALFSLWVDFLEWVRPGQTAESVHAFAEMNGMQEQGANGSASRGSNGVPAGVPAGSEPHPEKPQG